ncbi:MAG: chemotaxis protein CheX [Thermoguttaceae bacterium]|nr:chemotaxis protein CheX [Thermoguttaceae bacterium]MDW8039481.1 chemotaxis protein CheX [Thermoguttaceae bacterium]
MSDMGLPGNLLGFDPVLVKALFEGVTSGLTMCGLKARCVGISRIPLREAGDVTGLIGVHGAASGFVAVNMAERVALKTVGALLQDQFDALCPQVIDGVGEITNIITGGIKKVLAGSPWAFSHVTVPSVIVGRQYEITYIRGLEYLCALFEHEMPETILLQERIMTASVSLIRT